jgi:hypothetical protein
MALFQFDFRTALADRIDPVEDDFVMIRIDASLGECGAVCGRQGVGA